MKVNGIATGECVGVVRVIFESADVVSVFIDICDDYPHPFGLLVASFCALSRETKKKLYIV